MQLKRVGVDIAKSVFQIHGVDSHEQVKVRKQIRRQDFLVFSGNWRPVWSRWKPVVVPTTGPGN